MAKNTILEFPVWVGLVDLERKIWPRYSTNCVCRLCMWKCTQTHKPIGYKITSPLWSLKIKTQDEETQPLLATQIIKNTTELRGFRPDLCVLYTPTIDDTVAWPLKLDFVFCFWCVRKMKQYLWVCVPAATCFCSWQWEHKPTRFISISLAHHTQNKNPSL